MTDERAKLGRVSTNDNAAKRGEPLPRVGVGPGRSDRDGKGTAVMSNVTPARATVAKIVCARQSRMAVRER